MPKYLIPQTIKPNAFGAMLDPKDPTFGQLHFWEDQAVYYVVLSRSEMKNLAANIERVLSATPLPSGDQQSDRSR